MRCKVVAVGEVLWDLLPSGKQLGGAPANFACHARVLGADARLVTRVGHDPLGREALERLRLLGLPTDTVGEDAEAPTGTVDVEVGSDGQPHFTIRQDVAWDRLTADAAALAAVAEADAVCFGSLAQREPRSRQAIRSLVGAAPSSAWRVFDVNLRPPFVVPEVLEASLGLANALKLNDQELPVLAGMLGLPGDARGGMAELARRYGLALVALTRGAAGSLLLAGGQWSDHPGVPAEVCDTVGAGDAFTAAVVVGLLARWPLDRINQAANEVAAFVCTRPGATPALPEEKRRRYALQERGELAGPR
jgi:fructokinase